MLNKSEKRRLIIKYSYCIVVLLDKSTKNVKNKGKKIENDRDCLIQKTTLQDYFNLARYCGGQAQKS